MYSEINSLLEASRKGDRNAKEKLLQEVKPLILASIKRNYNRVELYDDLIQEGYEIVLESIESYDPEKGTYFLGYIKMKLYHHYLDKYKKKETLSLNRPVDENGTEFIDLLEGNGKEAWEGLVATEDSLRLANSLRELTERQREIILDFYFHKLSLGQIAEKLGVSYRTVVNTKTRALEKLKIAMVK